MAILAVAANGQSSDPNFPTPITSNEISGTIKARDVGDARLTRYFYEFDGGQGDIFVNVVTKNFSGDIDVFTAEALKPVTKMVIYPDAESTETGRLIYLRKGERLILRIEGRSPNDDSAIFRIKFGGNFIALERRKGEEAPTLAKAENADNTGIRVNSVGTIVEVLPKPKAVKASAESEVDSTDRDAERDIPPSTAKKGAVAKPASSKPTVVITEAPGVPTIFGAKKAAGAASESVKKPEPKPKAIGRTGRSSAAAKSSGTITKPPSSAAEKAVDPLASIRLVVQMKSGETIERPMSEVLKFSVDKGILTVIAKDGKISRFSILDVAKVTIE